MIVYKITNRINGKVFIGYTIYPLHIRKKLQIYEATKDTSGFLYDAISRYGSNNFSWSILEYCNKRSESFKCREFYIKKYNSMNRNHGYNCQSGGQYFSLVEESKEKMKESRFNLPEHIKNKIKEAARKSATGRVDTPETRQKRIDSHTGEKNYMFGRHRSAKTKKKIGEANRDKVRSLEVRKKMSEANKGEKNYMFGRHHSAETIAKIVKTKTGSRASKQARKNMSIAKSGENHPQYGKHPTSEALVNMSIAQKKRYADPEQRKKASVLAKTRKKRAPITDEQRKNMSIAQKKRYSKKNAK